MAYRIITARSKKNTYSFVIEPDLKLFLKQYIVAATIEMTKPPVSAVHAIFFFSVNTQTRIIGERICNWTSTDKYHVTGRH